VEPSIEGSSEEPDVLATMQLLSFNLGSSEEISPDTRATMRINFGKDENSRDKYFDTAFWSIAAGLKLYDEARGKQTESKDLQVDFRKAFGNRPVEIPGGLSKLSFEVVQHTEPAWWQKIFRFAGSGAAKNLISVLGFPAITYQAIGVLDELLNKLVDSQPKVLFKSLPMRLALSKQARQDFTAGNPRIRMGCLTAGFCILARVRDYDTIAEIPDYILRLQRCRRYGYGSREEEERRRSVSTTKRGIGSRCRIRLRKRTRSGWSGISRSTCDFHLWIRCEPGRQGRASRGMENSCLDRCSRMTSMAVASDALASTHFDVPANQEKGPSELVVSRTVSPRVLSSC
jgi:hypothetical protein